MSLRYEAIEIPTRGFAVLDTKKTAFVSLAIFETLDEAGAVATRHNEAAKITEHWPEADDPEVVALLNDTEFEPIRENNIDSLDSPIYRLHRAAEVVARRRAGLHELEA